MKLSGSGFTRRRMTIGRSTNLMMVLVATLAVVACGKKEQGSAGDAAKEKATAEVVAKEKEALETTIEAYVYAYPLVTMEYTRRALTNTAAPEGTKAPMGQFVRLRRFRSPSGRYRHNRLVRGVREKASHRCRHHLLSPAGTLHFRCKNDRCSCSQ